MEELIWTIFLMHRKKIDMEHPLSWTRYSQQPGKSDDISTAI